jgi:hypothetical protein
MAELREDSDELVRRITESFLAYRELMVEYMPLAETPDERPRPRLQLRLSGQHLLTTAADALDRVNAWSGAPSAGWRSSCPGAVRRGRGCAIMFGTSYIWARRPSSICTPPSSCWAPATRSWSTAMCGSTSLRQHGTARGRRWSTSSHGPLPRPHLPRHPLVTWRFTANSWASARGPLSVGGIPASLPAQDPHPGLRASRPDPGPEPALRSIVRLRGAGHP